MSKKRKPWYSSLADQLTPGVKILIIYEVIVAAIGLAKINELIHGAECVSPDPYRAKVLIFFVSIYTIIFLAYFMPFSKSIKKSLLTAFILISMTAFVLGFLFTFSFFCGMGF